MPLAEAVRDAAAVAAHLVRRGLAAAAAEVELPPLPGGVSNDVVAVSQGKMTTADVNYHERNH